MKELHVLIVEKNTHVKMRQDIERPVTLSSVPIEIFIHMAARDILIISRRSSVNIMLNYVLGSLKKHSKRS